MLTDTDVINQNRNHLMFLMASISPKVANSLELELYRTNAYSDESTEEHILEDCLSRLLEDLGEIGLSFNIDISAFIDNTPQLSLFVQLCMLLLPNTLYDLIKHDSVIRVLIGNIVLGSLGDDDTVIQTYLNELAGLDGNLPIYPHLEDFIDQIYPLVKQTDIFTDYFSNLIDLYQQERPAIPADEERLIQYNLKIKDLVGKLSDAVNLFENSATYDALCQRQNFIIQDLIAPDNFIPYAYILLEDRESLPEDIRPSYDRRWYQYFVSHSWNLEYFKIRNLLMTEVDEEISFCFLYAITNNKDEFIQGINKFQRSPTNGSAYSQILKLFQE